MAKRPFVFAEPGEYRFVGMSKAQKEEWVKRGKAVFDKASEPPVGLTEAGKKKYAMTMKLKRERAYKELEEKGEKLASVREVHGVEFKRGEWVKLPEKHSLLKLAQDKAGEPIGICKIDSLVESGDYEKKAAGK